MSSVDTEMCGLIAVKNNLSSDTFWKNQYAAVFMTMTQTYNCEKQQSMNQSKFSA